MVRVIVKEITETVNDDARVVNDDRRTIIVEEFEGDVFLTKLDCKGKETWILSKEIAQKLKEAL